MLYSYMYNFLKAPLSKHTQENLMTDNNVLYYVIYVCIMPLTEQVSHIENTKIY